ncbi:hypothetical protein GNI_060050 [Gregarina niphandrodes]|uniref:Uncharacterized protein n=1 Tax=Gregarina niphandrodes TaxID=110365 RepID=A0A023B8H9_GRENI|nr:hypothetical protein GNI_060050 [Gregarina niphandrodes]EZG69098.1 hypothetical protein GNI_060050 [Gregarina niphandrodes]|eukprot:XP_011134503.1 hypothetical protein GNI_060050 [Gregarina niphandrodes]
MCVKGKPKLKIVESRLMVEGPDGAMVPLASSECFATEKWGVVSCKSDLVEDKDHCWAWNDFAGKMFAQRTCHLSGPDPKKTYAIPEINVVKLRNLVENCVLPVEELKEVEKEVLSILGDKGWYIANDDQVYVYMGFRKSFLKIREGLRPIVVPWCPQLERRSHKSPVGNVELGSVRQEAEKRTRHYFEKLKAVTRAEVRFTTEHSGDTTDDEIDTEPAAQRSADHWPGGAWETASTWVLPPRHDPSLFLPGAMNRAPARSLSCAADTGKPDLPAVVPVRGQWRSSSGRTPAPQAPT